MSPELKKRLTKARVQLLLGEPFWGQLAFKLTNNAATQYGNRAIPTAATNGTEILWNEEWAATLTDKELTGVMVHEIMHVAQGHCWRVEGREPMRWNLAIDASINKIIIDEGFIIPKDCIMPTKEMEGKSAEVIYNMIPELPKGFPSQSAGKEGKSFGDVMEPAGGSGAAKELEEEWKQSITAAAETARQQGKLPAGMDRFISDLLSPKVPWHILLRDFVQHSAKNDFNWNRPNTRHLQRGFILPSLISEHLPDIVIAIDTSGSIGGEELNQFASEVSSVLGSFETTIHIAFFDTEVASYQTVTRADLPLKLKPAGGGGSSALCIPKWIDEQGIDPAAVVVLTDGYLDFFEDQAEYPTMWVMTTDQTSPYGQTVRMN